MKKALALIALLTNVLVSAQAQVYDEAELFGKWNVTQIDGTLTYPFNFYNLEFSSVCKLYTYNDDYGRVRYRKGRGQIYYNGFKSQAIDSSGEQFDEGVDDCWATLDDYFISSNNKIHLKFDNGAFVAKISFLSSSKMVLEMLDGSCKITLVKDETSAVRSLQTTDTEAEGVYDLQGRRLPNEPAEGIYIQGGRTIIAK